MLRYTRQRSVYTFDKLNTVLRESSQTMDEVRKAATTWNQASKDQSQYATLALGSVRETTASIQTLVRRTDASLNDLVLPNLAASVKEQNRALLKTQENLQANLSQMSTAIQQAQKVLVDVDKQVSSPDIQIALDNVATSSANLATATREGAASMTDVHTALDYELKQLMAPVTKLKLAGNIALNVIRHLYF